MRKVTQACDTSKLPGAIAASSVDSASRITGHKASARGVGLTP